MAPTLGDDHGRVVATGISAAGRGRLLSLSGLAMAVSLLTLAVTAIRPAPAFGCPEGGHCEAPIVINCPQMSAGSTEGGFVTFDIPKDAKNVVYAFTNPETGEHYTAGNPLCAGATLTSSVTRTPGATKDSYTVNYTLTSNGSSDPNESHAVTVTADWSRESDLGITKQLLGGGSEIDAEQEAVFSIVIHNYGPGDATSFELSDQFSEDDDSNLTILKAEQTSGPAADSPGVSIDRFLIEGEWSKLKVDEEIVVLVHVRVSGSGTIGNNGTVKHILGSKRFEPSPDPHSNDVRRSFTVQPAPDSKIDKAGEGGVSGTAEPPPVMRAGSLWRASGPAVDHVEIAILRTGGGKPLKGTLPADQTNKPGSCEWVRNKKGKLGGRAPVDGVCDSPIWLDAKGTGDWKLKLKDDLGKGKYVVYSRAVGEDGVGEGSFTKADGNREVLKVR